MSNSYNHGLPSSGDISGLPLNYLELGRLQNIDKVAKLPYMISLAQIGIRTAVIDSLVSKANISNHQMVYDGKTNPFEIGVGIKNANQPAYDAPIDGVMSADGFTPQSGLQSVLGTYVYSNLVIQAGNGFTQIKSNMQPFQWNDFVINDCLVTVSQAKRLVVTDIQGKDNQVIEYIGMSNYNIEVTGRLTGSYKVYPKDQANTLKNILSVPQPLAIGSWWLQNLGITDIVITNYDFGQAEGEYSTQYFKFNAISDVPTEAYITQ